MEANLCCCRSSKCEGSKSESVNLLDIHVHKYNKLNFWLFGFSVAAYFSVCSELDFLLSFVYQLVLHHYIITLHHFCNF